MSSSPPYPVMECCQSLHVTNLRNVIVVLNSVLVRVQVSPTSIPLLSSQFLNCTRNFIFLTLVELSSNCLFSLLHVCSENKSWCV